MAVSDDSVEPYLMEVGRLKSQHLVNAIPVDRVRRLAHLVRGTVRASKLRLDQVLAVLVEEVERVQVGAGRNLDQLGKAVPDLGDGQRPQEGEVEKGVQGRVVRSKAVLVVAVVDRDLDRDRRVNEPDHRGRHPDVVGASPIRRTCESDGPPEISPVAAQLVQKQADRVP